LEETIECLKEPFAFTLGLKEKPELFFVFDFDGRGESVLILRQELKMISNRASKIV
jgi:hypothetical protein